MISKKKLFIFGEEKPNSSGVYNSISYVLDKLNIPYESSLYRFNADLCEGSSRKYEISGFCSYEFTSIEYRMVSGNTSMVDLMFYLQEETPTNQSKPVYFVEITKNNSLCPVIIQNKEVLIFFLKKNLASWSCFRACLFCSALNYLRCS